MIMDERAATGSRTRREPVAAATVIRLCKAGMAVATVLAACGVAIGLVMVDHRVRGACGVDSSPDPCWSYPHAGEGAAIAILSALVLIGVLIAGVTAVTLVRSTID